MVRPESDLTLEALAERVEELERRLSMLGNASSPAEVAPAASARVGGGAPQYAAVPAQSTSHAPSVPVAASTGSSGQPAPSAQVPAALAAQDDSGRNAAWPQGSASAPVAHVGTANATGLLAPSAPQATRRLPPLFSQPDRLPRRPKRFSRARQQRLPLRLTCPNPRCRAALVAFGHRFARKVNPARGVLFMNAKVSAEADGQGIVVEYRKR